MKRGARYLLELARSQPGRLELKRRYSSNLWPVFAYLARLYRRTLGRRPRIVAVIGSVGKTTTMRTVSAVLERPVRRPALLNANSHAAVGRALLAVRPWDRNAVIEVAINAPGQMHVQAATLRPQVVVVTAIARDHWRSFGTLEATRHAKADMLRRLPASAVVVANADDPHVRWMATQTRARVVLAGEADDAEVRATDVALDWPRGMRFTVSIGGQAWPATTRLVGRHMLFGALAALTVGHLEGVPMEVAIRRLAAVEPTPGRMQTMALTSGAYALRDEFKASEHTFDAALETLAQIPARRKIGVLGEVAEESGHAAYRELGHKAASLDQIVFVGSRKRMTTLRAAATAAGMAPDRVRHVHNAHEALALVRGELGPGDVLFIKGRWQQALGRVGLALAGRDVQCRADPCPFKRMLCDVCPFLGQPFEGLPGTRVESG
ncbi:MAG TPA: Mur ligase family protein [Candidatus Limnocylindrales bacterium]